MENIKDYRLYSYEKVFFYSIGKKMGEKRFKFKNLNVFVRNTPR